MTGATVAIERAYRGRDNEIALQVLTDGAPIDGGAVTRTLLRLTPEAGGDVVDVDSAEHGGVFQWRDDGIVEIKLAAAEHVIADRYAARLIVFDADHPNGLVWGRSFSLIYEP